MMREGGDTDADAVSAVALAVRIITRYLRSPAGARGG